MKDKIFEASSAFKQLSSFAKNNQGVNLPLNHEELMKLGEDLMDIVRELYKS